MKVLLCAHGHPDELVGGTELAVQALARALVRAGDDVVVVAGTVQRARGESIERRETIEAVEGAPAPRVIRLARPDLYFDHWQKSRSSRVAAAFRELLREEAPDVVHVHHWIRLSRELVTLAAAEGIPSVVTLHDHWVSCPLAFRVRPEDGEACGQPLSALGCIPCLGHVPPRTPWVPVDAQFMEFAKREHDLLRELRLARALVVPTVGHGERLRRFLGDGAFDLRFLEIPPAAPPRWPGTSAPPPPGDGRPLRLACWGRLSRLKGIDFLFEALAELEPEGSVELRLAGEEDPPGLIDELAARFARVRVVRWGPFRHEELGAHPVREAHAMVHAGRAPESFGLVLEEARALGLPAILPELGAFADRAGAESGALLYPPGDATALRRLLSGWLEDPGRLAELRAAVPQPVREEAIVAAHRELYARVVAGGPPARDEVPATEWYAERMDRFAEEAWDRSLANASAEELGFSH